MDRGHEHDAARMELTRFLESLVNEHADRYAAILEHYYDIESPILDLEQADLLGEGRILLIDAEDRVFTVTVTEDEP